MLDFEDAGTDEDEASGDADDADDDDDDGDGDGDRDCRSDTVAMFVDEDDEPDDGVEDDGDDEEDDEEEDEGVSGRNRDVVAGPGTGASAAVAGVASTVSGGGVMSGVLARAPMADKEECMGCSWEGTG